jgi:hypothetical protein
MRKPRPQDFDPNYKASKSFQPDQIDISGTVPIKPHSTIKKENKPNRSESRTENRTEVRSELRSELRSHKLPIKRRTKRYSFEFYDDQLQQIRQLKIKAEMNGDSLTMSEIVRQAVDEYLSNYH